MIVRSKKKIEQEIRRRARIMAQREIERREAVRNKKKIRTLEQRLAELEKKVSKLKSAGTVKGYYQGDDGKVIICESEEKDHDR